MYVKLFEQILRSSIWLESDATLRVWITLLVSMDQDGFAQFACVDNLGLTACVDLEDCIDAVRTLESPDPNSSDPDNEGRRIERVPGGWIVLNAEKYREMGTAQNRRDKNRERAQRFRDKKAASRGNGVDASDKARNASVTPRNAGVTPRNASSRTVTQASHENNDMYKQKQKQRKKKIQVQDLKTDTTPNSLKQNIVERGSTALFSVFEHWKSRLKHPEAKLTPKRKARVRARLDEGYTVEQITQAIDGCASSPFHQGANDNGKVYDDLELICRSGEKLEQFIQVTQQGDTNGQIIRSNGPRRETTSERRWRETSELCAALEADAADPGIALLQGIPAPRTH